HFLTGRYNPDVHRRAGLYRGRVRPSPYPLRRAAAKRLRQTVLSAAGLPRRRIHRCATTHRASTSKSSGRSESTTGTPERPAGSLTTVRSVLSSGPPGGTDDSAHLSTLPAVHFSQ